MRQEVKLTDALGKTLEGFAFSSACGQAVLAFSDGTFVTLYASRGHEHGDQEIEEDTLHLHRFGDQQLIEADITTAVELAEIRAARDAKLAETNAVLEAKKRRAADRRDKSEFERLKRKFSAGTA